MKTVMTVTGKSELSQTFAKKQEWMTDEIIDLINVRRDLKNKNEAEYGRIYKLIRKKINEAKQKWMQEKCKEIKALQKKHDEFHMHRKIKAITIKDETDKSIYGKEDLKNYEGVQTGGQTINNIRYADDTATMAETIEELQEMLNRIHAESLGWGLKINKQKTKMMIANKIEVGNKVEDRADKNSFLEIQSDALTCSQHSRTIREMLLLVNVALRLRNADPQDANHESQRSV
ncbi:hypothetical protein ILUMI_04627 [Ignelater luminosus]|uniref:Reverse transcriptase domain-containing protein n=1 Tax=Ignelater luminosus TaxID=2038154 RepID=A0A8K0GED3_IGNLU|nr:hypothetical protein ILUMI_04627 [Ignelater luminosus]